jgi:hypothetical protein
MYVRVEHAAVRPSPGCAQARSTVVVEILTGCVKGLADAEPVPVPSVV